MDWDGKIKLWAFTVLMYTEKSIYNLLNLIRVYKVARCKISMKNQLNFNILTELENIF